MAEIWKRIERLAALEYRTNERSKNNESDADFQYASVRKWPLESNDVSNIDVSNIEISNISVNDVSIPTRPRSHSECCIESEQAQTRPGQTN